ncbi:chromate efflux transporter [Roseomonas sp. 18066]|uniref:chromate efflux transporter n=1 Tax=Roseomonas sp. 18066 TaxID=2681412 RepID=UPI001F26179D|nr:chromate efflux transporter [Roseomonas sp. 18066]
MPPATLFLVFLRLGLTSFGGPVAHLGYFRAEFVTRRAWLGEADFAELLALSQFLPGPASSQLGFAIGLRQGGLAGGVAAWLGFTLPSALLMLAAGLAGGLWQGGGGAALVQGLKLVAVAVVAQAVCGMARGLCPDLPRRLLALLAFLFLMLFPTPLAQFAGLVVGAGLGLATMRPAGRPTEPARPPIPVAALAALAAFALLLAGLPLVAATGAPAWLTLLDTNYRAGALVFGGGHVVLPLLEGAMVPQLLPADRFLAGYGLAQALPGPLFALAAYLGAATAGVGGGIVALVAIFLPGLLLLYGALPLWARLRALPSARGALLGLNAVVVGILAAALVDPIATSSLKGAGDAAIALLGFAALVSGRFNTLGVLAAIAAAGALLAAA